ncbi:polysaccharide lyase family 14 protein [Plicaturopsis crispa FD-325 SS-3]|nr:polysaccharide lyase family 14 protein [Plicaturopsis crispa FD-325 SS-3]
MVLTTSFFYALTLGTLSAFSAPVSAPGDISVEEPLLFDAPVPIVATLADIPLSAVSVLFAPPAPSPPASLPTPSVVPDAVPVLFDPPAPSVLASPPLALIPAILTEIETEIFTATQTVTDLPTTVTVAGPPLTVTDVITVYPTSSSVPPTAPSSTAWTAPPTMTDLASWNVSTFAGGKQNLAIVQGIPANASATASGFTAESTSTGFSFGSTQQWENSSSVLQLLYPANSIDPATKPQGGAEFYASPLPLGDSQNITLEYSVFFPADYDWVQGGKLPGMYGGHTGCSGGSSAKDCFSTRLMWRQDGAGELYLYAPKDQQTTALCAARGSVCDAAYGFSIGRASFNFAAGAWTHVTQTVILNAPGEQNGGFTLVVNGKRVIHRTDVFYRDVPAPAALKPAAPKTTKTVPKPTSASGGGGLLGGLLGDGLLGELLWGAPGKGKREYSPMERPPLLPLPTALGRQPPADAQASALLPGAAKRMGPELVQVEEPSAPTATGAAVENVVNPTATIPSSTVTVRVVTTALPVLDNAARTPVVGFQGIFFSTFFGGHEQRYATPRDQYTWFKDFAMTSNNHTVPS